MTKPRFSPLVAILVLISANHTVSADQTVRESARQIPLAYEVDVVVVGGGTGAISAAVTAAREGASVFLAAPFPYLGDDMTATLRLWLEADEKPDHPLARDIFDDQNGEVVQDPNRLEFTYEIDSASAPIHRETTPPSRLTDGKWTSASQESVQFDRDTNVTADLGEAQPLQKIRLIFFRRPGPTGAGGGGFDVERVAVSVSDDKEHWRKAGSVDNIASTGDISVLTVPMKTEARYVRLFIQLAQGYQRMLLGEVEVIGVVDSTAQHAQSGTPPPRPMHIKKTLDDALLEAGVKYLYSCYATDLLRDESGELCGIVMANRAGRQAIVAKKIIDTTPRAIIARLAGVEFEPFEGGTHTYRRVVIGGKAKQIDGIQTRIAAPPFGGIYPTAAVASGGSFPVIEYTLPLHINDASYDSLMKVDQLARSITYDPDQQFTSDILFEVPTDPMRGSQSADAPWQGAAAIPLAAFRPENTRRLFVLSGSAAVSRSQAAMLMRPLSLIELGQRLGKTAAVEANQLPRPRGVHLPGETPQDTVGTGNVKEILAGVRPTQETATVPQANRQIPVLGTYDVVVIGGGTGGAPAGIGAARHGAKTLVIEYLHGLGGVGTQGAISSYYWGNRVGFTATVLDGAAKWPIEPKMEWYRQQLLDAGADIWFGTIGCGVYVQNNRVAGAVVATPFGRGVVLANTVIDATGNSDVAAAAGAECIYTDATEFGMQGTGLPGRKLGGSYNNTDFTIVDETDMVDVWRMLVFSKEKYTGAFDHGRLIDTRERRRIVGDMTITMTDELNQRTYPDSVVRTYSNFDTHGYTIDPYFLVEHPETKGIYVSIPFRSMLPKGLDGIIVTGLSISAHRDAIPLIRMQADIQNGGYAAGVAAAMAAQGNVPVRQIDVRQLQQHLVEIGNLPESVLSDQDSYPLPDERIAAAVKTLLDGQGAAVIWANPGRALPMLEKAYRQAKGHDRLVYAKVLSLLGSNAGLETIRSNVQQADNWDEGWNYRGMGQFGAALSPLDNLIVLMGHTKDASALPAIIEKVALLDATSEFSHHRAVGRALELINDPRAAKPLAELLAKPEMRGHVHVDLAKAKDRGVSGGTNSERTRRESLRELLLARALYRCGDFNNVGEQILRSYTKDLRGHLARHASAVLSEAR